MQKSKLLFGIMLMSASASPAASPHGVWFVGGTGSESPNTYIGVVHALPGGRLGQGLAVRGSLGAGSYNYDAASGNVRARYMSASAGLIYQKSGAWGWSNLSAGPRLTRTKLSRSDPSNEERGSRWDLALQSDGGFQRPGWDARWLGSYGIRDKAYQTRLQMALKVGAKLAVGPEVGLQGGRNYKQRTIGAFVRSSAFSNIELQAGGGVIQQQDRSSRGYIGLALSRPF